MLENNLSEIYFFIESLTLSEIFVFYSIAYMGVVLVKIVAEIEVNLTNFKFSEKLLATIVILHLLFTLSYIIQNETLLNDEIGSKAAAVLLLVLILKTFEKLKGHYLVSYFGSRLTKEAERVLPEIQEKRKIPQKVDVHELRLLSRTKSDQYTPMIKEYVLFSYMTTAATITVVLSSLYSGIAVAVLSIVFILLMYKRTKQDILRMETVYANGLIKQA